jgi:hypothetical protein
MSEALVQPQPSETTSGLSNHDILFGPPVPPEKRVLLYSDAEWEEFIEEWAYGLKEKYLAVLRVSGPGDKGRDVLGFYGEPGSDCEWDNYQCKHYGDGLTRTDAYPEIGKLCYHTFRKEYTVPKRYYFVAPRECGSTLASLLLDPEKLKEDFVANWEQLVADKITKTATIRLSGDLQKWVSDFDFSLIKNMPVRTILDQHSQTRFHAR